MTDSTPAWVVRLKERCHELEAQIDTLQAQNRKICETNAEIVRAKNRYKEQAEEAVKTIAWLKTELAALHWSLANLASATETVLLNPHVSPPDRTPAHKPGSDSEPR